MGMLWFKWGCRDLPKIHWNSRRYKENTKRKQDHGIKSSQRNAEKCQRNVAISTGEKIES